CRSRARPPAHTWRRTSRPRTSSSTPTTWPSCPVTTTIGGTRWIPADPGNPAGSLRPMQVSTAATAVLLPLTLLFAALAGCPAGPAVARVRLAVLRGGLVVGTVTVLA